jgi:hypothetical protein
MSLGEPATGRALLSVPELYDADRTHDDSETRKRMSCNRLPSSLLTHIAQVRRPTSVTSAAAT